MSVRCTLLIGIVIFLLPFAIETGRHWWRWTHPQLFPACGYNLKALWLLSRRVSSHYQLPFPPPLRVVKLHYIDSGSPLLVTQRMAEYLGMSQQSVGVYTDFRGILLCIREPTYLLKMARMSQGLDYEPSYLWQPDAKTLAFCPFCRLAVLLDGRIEKR